MTENQGNGCKQTHTEAGRAIPQWGGGGGSGTVTRSRTNKPTGGGFQKDITDDNLEYFNLRDPAGHKVVNKPARDALKRGFMILSDDEKFQKESNDLMARLDYKTNLMKAYTMAREKGLSLLALGWLTAQPLDAAPQRVLGIDYVKAIPKSQVKKYVINSDPTNDKYGEIDHYILRFNVDNYPVEKQIDASRFQHINHEVHENDPAGVPVLKPLFDIFQVKKNADLSIGQSIWRYASPFSVLYLPEDADGEEFKEASENFYLDGRNEFVAPTGYKVEQFGAKNALNPEPYTDYIWQNISAGSELTKVELMGTEAGSVTGSETNQATYFADIADDQNLVLEAYIVEFLRLCQVYKILGDADFKVWWPSLWELNAKEKAEISKARALALNQTSQAILNLQSAGFDVELDAGGFFIPVPGEGGEDLLYRVMDFPKIEGDSTTVTARTNKYKAAKVSKRDDDEARKLWDLWGMNLEPLENKHYAIQLAQYTEIGAELLDQTKAILDKELPDLPARTTLGELPEGAQNTTDEVKAELTAEDILAKEKLERVRKETLEDAVKQIQADLNIPKDMAMDVLFNQMLNEAHRFGSGVTADAMGEEIEYSMTPERAEAFLSRSQLLWEETHNQVLGSVKYQIIEGFQNGEGYQQIYDRIGEATAKVAKPKTLVNTEVHRAAERGRLDTFEQLGVEMVEWLTAGDGKVRKSHQQRDTLTYTLKEAEVLISEPNCRCTLMPVMVGATNKLRNWVKRRMK